MGLQGPEAALAAVNHALWHLHRFSAFCAFRAFRAFDAAGIGPGKSFTYGAAGPRAERSGA